MEIQKKASEPETKRITRKSFVRYGSIAAALLLVCGSVLGLALTRGARGAAQQSSTAPDALTAAESAPDTLINDTASGGNTQTGAFAAGGSAGILPETPASYDALYELMFGMDNYYGSDKAAAMTGESAVPVPSSAEAVASDAGEPRTGMDASFEGGMGDGMGGADYSGTNVQVAGVDEADIVKTDGNYIYYLANDQLVILKAAGKDTALVSMTEYAKNTEGWWGYASEMFLLGDRLMIITGAQNLVWVGSGQNRWQDMEERTLSLIYDVSDPANPTLVTTLGQSGNYVSSRLVDNYVYLITTRYIYNMQRGDPRTYVPTLGVDLETEPMPVKNIYLYPNADTPVYTVISAFDLESGMQQASSRAALGRTGDVYCSGKNLLLAANDYREEASPIAPGSDGRNVQVTKSTTHTQLMLFALDGAKIDKTAVASVPGTLVNQFAMDEWNGTFRIVTTVNEWTQYVYTDGVDTYDYDDLTFNCLYTLDDKLAVLGSLDHLAEGEWVQSVRFDGDIAYFVTFRQVDPLFTVDVSDPRSPKILSTLKIPGFSEYLHVFADGRLVGIGYDANEQTGATHGVKLTMFDTSDKADVRELTTMPVDADWTVAGSNHKSILINAEKNIIAFPADESYYIFSYSDAAGFCQNAAVRLNSSYWSGGLRGLFIGNALYVLSQTGTVVLDLTDFSTLAELMYA